VVLNAVNALAKVGNTFNLLWRDAKCACCELWWRDGDDSVGSYAPARAVFNQRKRGKVLGNHAAGPSKAVGRWDPSVTEEQREEALRSLLLTQKTAAECQLKSVLTGLFVFTFSLDARGGTAWGVIWSDLAVRRFTVMFSELGGPIYVLRTYITVSKTKEGIVHNIGVLGHVILVAQSASITERDCCRSEWNRGLESYDYSGGTCVPVAPIILTRDWLPHSAFPRLQYVRSDQCDARDLT